MLKKELAQHLGVSESMVSRHAKQGMPTDSVERAQRWRKRHLEPGRVKGSRYDSKAKPAEKAAKMPDIAQCVALLGEALQAGPVPHDAPLLLNTRHALRTLPDWRAAAESVEMPVRVWVRLIAVACSDDVLGRVRAMVQACNMTAAQLADELHDGDAPTWAAGCLLEAAWDLHALDGKPLPDDDGDDDE